MKLSNLQKKTKENSLEISKLDIFSLFKKSVIYLNNSVIRCKEGHLL